jgi:adenylosuccinate synthase
MVREPFGLLQEALEQDAAIVLEGAQGALLDNNWGTYPFCTASGTCRWSSGRTGDSAALDNAHHRGR